MSSESTQPSENPSEGSDVLVAQLVDEPGRGKRNLGGWLVILLIASTLLGPMLYYGIPEETAKWRLATAQNQWAKGDLGAAVQTLDAAIASYPKSEALYLQRVEFCLEQQDYEKALADCERLAELSPKTPDVHHLRAQTLQHLERSEEAVAACREALRLNDDDWIGKRATALNGLAYYQALGEIDNLDERADVFGLGALLCEILTGKPPYVADDGTQIFRLAGHGKLDDCFQRLDSSGADAELIALTKQCLELEPIDL